MKKIYLTFAAIAVLTFAGVNTNAQITIYTQNFDNNGFNLPTGWTTTFNGWKMDDTITNRSAGSSPWVGTYIGASGLFNCKISNPTLDSNFVKNLTTNSISTTGDTGISVLWGARRSTHFPDSLSTIAFEFSHDGGTTWINVPYTENPNNSTWYKENDSTRINLPATANNQASLMFRWVATLHRSASGTYRIDDFNVQGTVSLGIADLTDNNGINMYMDNYNTLHIVNQAPNNANKVGTLTIYDITGRTISSEMVNTNGSQVALPALSTGIYFANLKTETYVSTKKFVITSTK